jgi:hypothetical protein
VLACLPRPSLQPEDSPETRQRGSALLLVPLEPPVRSLEFSCFEASQRPGLALSRDPRNFQPPFFGHLPGCWVIRSPISGLLLAAPTPYDDISTPVNSRPPPPVAWRVRFSYEILVVPQRTDYRLHRPPSRPTIRDRPRPTSRKLSCFPIPTRLVIGDVPRGLPSDDFPVQSVLDCLGLSAREANLCPATSHPASPSRSPVLRFEPGRLHVVQRDARLWHQTPRTTSCREWRRSLVHFRFLPRNSEPIQHFPPTREHHHPYPRGRQPYIPKCLPSTSPWRGA